MRRLILGLFLILAVSSTALAQSVSAPKSPKIQKKTALVFVQKADSTWEPRIIEIGLADYDYTEVVSGLKEGERVAQLSAALMQAKREASNAQMSQAVSGNSPLGGTTTARPRN